MLTKGLLLIFGITELAIPTVNYYGNILCFKRSIERVYIGN